MVDRRVTSDTALTGAATADGDLVDLVDVSDSTDAGTGTNKRQTMSEHAVALRTRLTAGGDASGPLSALVLANTGVAAGSYGTTTVIPRLTIDAKGRITAVANQTVLAGAGLPTDWYDITQHGVTPLGPSTGGATNSTNLQAMVSAIPAGKAATFVVPYGANGQYQLNSTVDLSGRVINFLGAGSPSGGFTFPFAQPTFYAGTAGMTMFQMFGTGGTGTQQFSSSFEQIGFSGLGFGGTERGIYTSGAQRFHLRYCNFDSLQVGTQLDTVHGDDNAFHTWIGNHWSNCQKGLYAPSSNSWSMFGAEFDNCLIGAEIQLCNSSIFDGIKVNTRNANGAFGLKLGWTTPASGGFSGNVVRAAVEMNPGPNATAIQVDGVSSIDTSGSGNMIDLIYLHGGGDATNKGIVFTAGGHDNQYRVGWQAAIVAPVTDGGARNYPLAVYGVSRPTQTAW